MALSILKIIIKPSISYNKMSNITFLSVLNYNILLLPIQNCKKLCSAINMLCNLVLLCKFFTRISHTCT